MSTHTATPTVEKVRRAAATRGLRLVKSRDTNRPGYWVEDRASGMPVYGFVPVFTVSGSESSLIRPVSLADAAAALSDPRALGLLPTTALSREARMRRVAQRRGLRLHKLRRSLNPTEAAYRVSDAATAALLLGGRWGVTIGEVEEYLQERAA